VLLDIHHAQIIYRISGQINGIISMKSLVRDTVSVKYLDVEDKMKDFAKGIDK